ncbi:conserved hypothetical protein [Beutenbergia cavernae DSM 12333]|uniref:Uncharacterized protein n=1 Tax=Beutenbergia cavernae (strain ATCC BAA-8 / DSM 12333 / CCUG 43141 / JCM 11478 / NBRC 16432 / NCIMB 13614 / HKI 0122) TaxID=471853 RepID=C5BXH8_BEUC1|nr:conserved hypothetical protein [Beutenbergia cavernae DSM 12333]
MHPAEPAPDASTCPHCAAGTPHDHEVFADRVEARRAALARRCWARAVLATLLVGVVVVLGLRDGNLVTQVLTLAGSAVAWALAVVLGLLLGAMIARRRPPRVVLATSAMCAAGVAPLLAWLLVTLVEPAPLAPLAAGAGWFAAAGAAEVVRAATTRRLLDDAGREGDNARARETRLTQADDARDDRRALLTAAGFAVAVLVVGLVPPSALVLAPLAAALAALTSLRDRR